MDRSLPTSYLAWLAMVAACGFPRPPDLVQCTSAFDCRSPDAPFCVAGSCIAACQTNDDCAGFAATPFCQTSSGKCVGCLDASVCSADKPVCDASLNICRGCDRDDQCPSGVCVDSQGRCALANEIVYVSEAGSSDNAMCSAAAPCRTLTAAFAATTQQRYIIHIIGGTYRMMTGVAPPPLQVVIDGSDTNIVNDHGVTFSTTSSLQTITLSRVTINASEGTAVSTSGGAVLLYGVTLGAAAVATGGSLSIVNSTVQDARCSSAGVLDIEHSTTGTINSDSCGLTVLASRITGEIVAIGGKVIFENNLITSQDQVQDGAFIRSSISGSRFAFNTMVNFSGVDGTAAVIACNPGLDVSSNIFAWHSSASAGIDGCVPHDSLFDTLVPTQLVGANRQADAATFFVDLIGRKLQLSRTSPARGIGQPGIVDVDIDGAPRPSPANSRPDAGAYEAL